MTSKNLRKKLLREMITTRGKIKVAEILLDEVTSNSGILSEDIMEIRRDDVYPSDTLFHIMFKDVISLDMRCSNFSVIEFLENYKFTFSPFKAKNKKKETCLHYLFKEDNCNNVDDLIQIVKIISPYITYDDMMQKDNNEDTVWHIMFRRLRDIEAFTPLAHLVSQEVLLARNYYNSTCLHILFGDFQFGNNRDVINQIKHFIKPGNMLAKEFERKFNGDTLWHKLFIQVNYYKDAFETYEILKPLLSNEVMLQLNCNNETCWHKLFSAKSRYAATIIIDLSSWLTTNILSMTDKNNINCVDILIRKVNENKFKVYEKIKHLIDLNVDLSEMDEFTRKNRR